MLNKLIALFALTIIGITIGILIMIKGWGLEIESYAWLIGLYTISTINGMLMATVMQSKEA